MDVEPWRPRRTPIARARTVRSTRFCGEPDSQQDSREWDEMSQATNQSTYHSMAMPGQTAQQAIEARNQIMSDYE